MSKLKHAVVIGAGIGGLAAAGALAGHFEWVTVLERHKLPTDTEPRIGVPQSSQVHTLMQGGLMALNEIFGGFDRDLIDAGAMPIRAGLDDRRELPGFDPFPTYDAGMQYFGTSRPFLEQMLRNRATGLPNVVLRQACRARQILIADDGHVSGVTVENADRSYEDLQADLVVDATARGDLTLASLEAAGRSAPQRTTIGVDAYSASATMTLPEVARDWKVVRTLPDFRQTMTLGALTPIEGNRHMAVVAQWHGEIPVFDQASFIEFARGLRTPTIYDAIKNATMFGKVERFGFPESSWRHYERLTDFPEGLLPLGDAMCRFNPIHAQGMSVAAKEALALKKILDGMAGGRWAGNHPLTGLTSAFLKEAAAIITTAWTLAAVPDLAIPKTRGERPADLQAMLARQDLIKQASAHDPVIFKLNEEVRQLVRDLSAFDDPDIVRRLNGHFLKTGT